MTMKLQEEIKIISHLHQETFQHPIWNQVLNVDCTHWMTLLLAIEHISDQKIQLDDVIPIEKQQQENFWASFEKKNYSVLALLQRLILTADKEMSQHILSHIFGNMLIAQEVIDKKLKELDIDSHRVKIKDLYVIAQTIFELPNALIKKIFSIQPLIDSANIPLKTLLFSCTQLDALMYLEFEQRILYCSFRAENQSIGLFSLLDNIHRIDHLVPYYHYFPEGLIENKTIQPKSEWMNVMGDTYFGEYYTEIRKCRGQDDALQRYGYGHSFEKIKSFFQKDDINCINFEAVFNTETRSPLQDAKAFILGADHTQTLEQFQHLNINLVNLANNHLKDYGSKSLKFTLDKFEGANICHMGAGVDQQKAHQFIELNLKPKKVAIFNGYWHRDIAYQDYDFYALGKSAGVACLNAILFEQIMQYRMQNPDAKIILICHWGIDFKSIHPEQEKLANLFTQIGVDLIIGHGAHTIQPVRYVNNKPVIFGIGNGVFNSNGEYEKYQALPFGAIIRINLVKEVVQLYPIFTDNLSSFWQPYPVNQQQFERASDYLTKDLNQHHFRIQKNDLGFYVELNI